MRKPWTAEENTIIEQNYRKMPTRKIAEMIGRSMRATQLQANKLGLSEEQKYLNKQQKDLIDKFKDYESISAIAELVGVKYQTVRSYLRRTK